MLPWKAVYRAGNLYRDGNRLTLPPAVGSVAPCPEVAAPVAFADGGELLTGLARRAALEAAHEVAERKLRRHRDEQMHVIAREHAFDDGHAELGAHLADDLAHPQAQFAAQDGVALLGRAHDVIAVIEDGVAALLVGHTPAPEKWTSPPWVHDSGAGV